MYYNDIGIGVLLGKTITKIVPEYDTLIFRTDDGKEYKMFHQQDCCEHVYVDDIVGDLDDLIGSPVLRAEESSNSSDPPEREYVESYTWTYYKLATIKGHVDIRWYGGSNGYYSESVTFAEIS